MFLRTLGEHIPIMQSHKKPSSLEFLRTPNFQDRSINSTFLRLCVCFVLFGFFVSLSGETPYKFNWSVNNWQKSCFFAKSLLYPHLKARYFSFSFYFSQTEIKKLRVDIQFISWNESQTQVIHALNISLHTLKDSTFFGAQL